MTYKRQGGRQGLHRYPPAVLRVTALLRPLFLAIAGPVGLSDRLSEWLTRRKYDDLGYVLTKLGKL